MPGLPVGLLVLLLVVGLVPGLLVDVLSCPGNISCVLARTTTAENRINNLILID